MPKSTPVSADMTKEQAAAARAAARREASEAAARMRVLAPKGDKAWNKARTRELFDLYKNHGDESARDELIENNQNLVRFLAAKFKDRGESFDDLVQVGTIGLIKAIDRFDPSMGNEFTTFATPTITGEIKRHFRDKGWSVRVPRRLQELSLKINGTKDELTAELQRPPSTEEVAARLGVSVDEVLEAMESSKAYSVRSLNGPSFNSDDEDSPELLDRINVAGDNDGVYDNRVVEETSSDNRMVIEDAIASFSPREQEVLHMRFDEGLTQVEIAEKLGVSQVQVSRLLRHTLKKIQEKIDPEGLMK